MDDKDESLANVFNGHEYHDNVYRLSVDSGLDKNKFTTVFKVVYADTVSGPVWKIWLRPLSANACVPGIDLQVNIKKDELFYMYILPTEHEGRFYRRKNR
jgi:hypothetical protein